MLAGGTLDLRYSGETFAIAPAPDGGLFLSIPGSYPSTGAIIVLHPDGTTSPYATASHRVTNLAVAPDGTLYGAQGNFGTVTGSLPAVGWAQSGSNLIARYGPGTETVIVGTGEPDPGTGAQTDYGPNLEVTPEGLTIAADGSLLFSSGHVVYKVNDPSGTEPWNGTSCSPTVIHPGADLSNKDLTGIDLRRCDLSGVDLTNTILTGARFDGSRGLGIVGTPASLPVGYAVLDGVLAGPDTDYSGANLDSLDLAGAEFTGVSFAGAHLWNTDLTNSHLAGDDFTGADLHATDFTGADLTGATMLDNVVHDDGVRSADFTGANLTNLVTRSDYPLSLVAPVFTGATVDGAVLRGVVALGSDPTVTSGGVSGTPRTLPITGSWRLYNGYLIAPYADLSGADLSGALQGGTKLTGANLTGANLTNADFNGGDFDHATLNGADLSNTNLTGATLTNTDLTGATLTNTDLTSTNFTGATGTPSGGSTATYANTTCPDTTIATSPDTCVTHGFAS